MTPFSFPFVLAYLLSRLVEMLAITEGCVICIILFFRAAYFAFFVVLPRNVNVACDGPACGEFLRRGHPWSRQDYTLVQRVIDLSQNVQVLVALNPGMFLVLAATSRCNTCNLMLCSAAQ
eukprot:TRINITY_DN4640_c0_g1_i1.p1 TRINITY_DN4640_c0_g1~~TRINITY_DN4640_c0_g1_i1.p1  ORF type:complete len:132 (-),score=3.93 TRINITY_DN4640_c0_g1_i1:113-472(-)